MGKGKIFITTTLLFFFTMGATTPVLSSSLDQVYQEQQRTEQRIRETENILRQKELERQRTLNEINALNRDMNRTNSEIETLEKRLTTLENTIKATEQDVEIKEQEVDERTSILETRFRQSYQVGQVSYLEILFQSSSVSDFLTRFEFLKRLTQNDTQLLAELEAERDLLEKKKQELLAKQQEVINTKVSKQQKSQQLQVASNRSQALVRQLEQDKESAQRMLNELEQESRRIAEEIRRLQSQGGQRPSRLVWPTPGQRRVTSNYGSRIHPITRLRSFHTGLDIAAPQGHNLVATANGRVIFAGWRGAYGNTIIIDHGGGMATLYAHLSTISVGVGDNVRANQSIGRIGSTGWSTGPHLHIEVLLDGNHTNPRPYLGI